jgi:hypothetical protein
MLSQEKFSKFTGSDGAVAKLRTAEAQNAEEACQGIFCLRYVVCHFRRIAESKVAKPVGQCNVVVIDDKYHASQVAQLLMTMSLVAASEARKARLLALRRKRAGEEVEGIEYVPIFYGNLS